MRNLLLMVVLAGVIVAFSSICGAGEDAVPQNNTNLRAVDLPTDQENATQLEEWLDKIKPAAGAKQANTLTNSQTNYWKTTVCRRTRRGIQE